MAWSPAFTICTAWPPVSAPGAVTGSSPWRSSHSRSAPRRAVVCSGTTEPRRRSTSSAVYVRSMPSQRASLIVVVPLAEVRTRALGGLGARENLVSRVRILLLDLYERLGVDGHNQLLAIRRLRFRIQNYPIRAGINQEKRISGPKEAGNGTTRAGVPGAVLGRVPGSAAQPAHHGLPADRRDPDRDRARDRRRRRRRLGLGPRQRGGRGNRRVALPGSPPDDRVPAEVPALVVRLEPRAAPVRQPGRRLSGLDGRPLPGHGRPAGGHA